MDFYIYDIYELMVYDIDSKDERVKEMLLSNDMVWSIFINRSSFILTFYFILLLNIIIFIIYLTIIYINYQIITKFKIINQIYQKN